MIYLAHAKLYSLVGTMNKIPIEGIEQLPEHGPAFIVSNINGPTPMPALMLGYSLMVNKSSQRKLNVFADIESSSDEKNYPFLRYLNFVPWSHDNAKSLLEQGELLIIFPENKSNVVKTGAMRNRLQRFDWTKFLPAIEASVPIYPMVMLETNEINPLSALWKIRLMCPLSYENVQEREPLENEAKKMALFAEGEIQAEINRMLRIKNRR